jgi:YidC/Oxa1 family membrane protein insertase
MNSSKNTMIAVAISMIALFAWEIFFVAPQREAIRKYNIENGINVEQTEASKLPDNIETDEASNFFEPDVLINETSRENGRINLENNNVKGSFSLLGGQLDDLVLKEYKATLDSKSPSVRLLSPKGSRKVEFIRFGWNSNDGTRVPDAEKTVWQQDANSNKATWNNGAGVEFSREVTIDEDYMITVTDVIKNNTSSKIKLTPYAYINRSHEDEQSYASVSHEGPLGVLDNKLHEYSYSDVESDKDIEIGSGKGWAGIADKYWLTAIIPPQSQTINLKVRHYVSSDKLKRFQLDYTGSPVEIAPDGTVEYTHNVFAGAKKLSLMDKYKDSMDIKLFDRAVDFGSLYFLTRPLFELLHYYYGLLGNFGLAILLLTVTVKALLFPLAYKSYSAMAKMKKLTPEINAIKERFKEDRVQLQQQMINFYKDRKINPAAGCLPLLIQIPIFFSLYKVLYITIEMRHAPFYGYIKDLTAPDPLNVFNLFGLVNWVPPTFMPVIGLLPIAFAVSMYISQLMSPPPSDPNHVIMMKWLPIIFLFMFSGFASGLVLYWTWSNIITIVQQYIITKRVTAKHG